MSKNQSKQPCPIWFLGDNHGNFAHVIEQFQAAREQGVTPHVVFLGDLECQQPLALELKEIIGDADVWYIPGNHDTDSMQAWEHLATGELASRNLHGQIRDVGGRSIAGLGGVFRSLVWAPPAAPNFDSYDDFRRKLKAKRPPRDWGLKETSKERLHLSTIFPDVVGSLGEKRANILVTHEAPGCHEYGWSEINALAEKMGVGYVLHGHQHQTRFYQTETAYQVIGVGFCGIVELSADGSVSIVLPGDFDGQAANEPPKQ